MSRLAQSDGLRAVAASTLVFFGCATNAIIFDADLLGRPMPGRDLKLLTMMQTCLESLRRERPC